MPFRLLYTRSAVRDIVKLDAVAKKKIKKKIEIFSQKPLSYAKKLVDPRIGTYRWRVGNYRVIFDIDGKNIVILRIGHRREIYKGD